MEQELEDPSVDESVVERAREYHQRQDGRYVKGRIAEIRDRPHGDGVMFTVDTPAETFAEHVANPSPENTELEKLAEEYGSGLVDISDMKGEMVWCEHSNGQWSMVIRRHPYHEKIGHFRQKLSSVNYLSTVTVLLFSPIIAAEIKQQKRNYDAWSTLYTEPEEESQWWADGVITATITFTLLIIAFVAVLVML